MFNNNRTQDVIRSIRCQFNIFFKYFHNPPPNKIVVFRILKKIILMPIIPYIRRGGNNMNKRKFALSTLLCICILISLAGGVSAQEQQQPTQTNYELVKKELKQKKGIKSLKIPESDKSKAKKDGKVKYGKVMKEIEIYFDSIGQPIETNLDDRKYQKLVLSLGGAVNDLPINKEQLIDFVKFIDLYENYEINDRISILSEKLNKNTIKEEEIIELDELLYPLAGESTMSGDNEPENQEMSLFAAGSNGYDPIDARDYARDWVSNSETLRNNDQFGYYSDYYNCDSCWNDCTNYVSQALMAGGMIHYTWASYNDSDGWYYSNSLPSYTWGGAHNFYLHWKERAGVAAYSSSLGVGDVINADFGGDGNIDHTAIITKVSSTSNSGKWLSQHTSDKEELTTVADWFSAGYIVYGYEMDKADN
jgi:hypothetical protein